jgi:hypothetical protein
MLGGRVLEPTSIGSVKDWTGSLTGAVDALAMPMLVAMGVLWGCLPARLEPSKTSTGNS